MNIIGILFIYLFFWWDSDRIETIVDPVQHSAIALSVFLEVYSQYLFNIIRIALLIQRVTWSNVFAF